MVVLKISMISGQDARTTRNFGYFFNWKFLNKILILKRLKSLKMLKQDYFPMIPQLQRNWTPEQHEKNRLSLISTQPTKNWHLINLR